MVGPQRLMVDKANAPVGPSVAMPLAINFLIKSERSKLVKKVIVSNLIMHRWVQTLWREFLAKEILTARYRLHNATCNSQEFRRTIE